MSYDDDLIPEYPGSGLTEAQRIMRDEMSVGKDFGRALDQVLGVPSRPQQVGRTVMVRGRAAVTPYAKGWVRVSTFLQLSPHGDWLNLSLPSDERIVAVHGDGGQQELNLYALAALKHDLNSDNVQVTITESPEVKYFPSGDSSYQFTWLVELAGRLSVAVHVGDDVVKIEELT